MADSELTARNKAIAYKAITGVFVDRDATIPAKLFARDYRQHNPTIPNGEPRQARCGSYCPRRTQHGKSKKDGTARPAKHQD
jgi:hypothetical protein